MKVQTFTTETASGRQVKVSIASGLFGAFIAVTPVESNPIRFTTRITPVRWVANEDVKYIPELQ